MSVQRNPETPCEEDRASVHRRMGPPGAGKTHHIKSDLRETIDDEYTLIEDIALIGYTTANKADLQEFLLEVFDRVIADSDDPEEEEKRVRGRAYTMHGLTLSALCQDGLINMDEDEYDDVDRIIAPDDDDAEHIYEHFFSVLGIEYESETGRQSERDGYTEDKPTGNKILEIEQWLAQRTYPVDVAGKSPTKIDLPPERVTELLEKWKSFKDRHNLYEHHDYIALALKHGITPDVSFLVIDEMQDYSPAEYAIIKQWRNSGVIDKIIICGDEWQSVYGFKAARPEYLTDTVVDDDMWLPVSWRCPSSIANVAQGVIDDYTDRVVIQSHPDRDEEKNGGNVGVKTVDSDSDVSSLVRSAVESFDGTDEDVPVYLLSRTNWGAKRLGYALEQNGIAYKYLGTKLHSPWEAGFDVVAKILRRVRAGSVNVSQEEAKTVLRFASNPDERKSNLSRVKFGDLVEYENPPMDITSAFPQTASWKDILARLDVSANQREMLMQAVAGDMDLDTDAVQIGTMHTSKGGQAETVFISDEYNKSLLDAYRSDAEQRAEEHRLYYVAATRAQKRLYAMKGLFGGKSSPVLDGGFPKHTSDPSEMVAELEDE